MSGQLTIERIASIEALSERISGYARLRDPVVDVDAYYQAHRRADRVS